MGRLSAGMALVVMVEAVVTAAGLTLAAVVADAEDAAHSLMLAVGVHDTPAPFDSNPSNNVPNLSSNPQTPSRYW